MCILEAKTQPHNQRCESVLWKPHKTSRLHKHVEHYFTVLWSCEYSGDIPMEGEHCGCGQDLAKVPFSLHMSIPASLKAGS